MDSFIQSLKTDEKEQELEHMLSQNSFNFKVTSQIESNNEHLK